MNTTMFCKNTPLAIIYADLPTPKSVPGSETLFKDIRVLEKGLWDHMPQKYLGIFTLEKGEVSPPFAEFAKFHASTETGWVVDEPGTFSPALQERLRSNGNTHVLFVGFEVAAAALEAKKQGFDVCIFQPATRALESIEDLTTAGIIVAKNVEQLVADFVCKIMVGIGLHSCNYCNWTDQLPRWCVHQISEFLWRASMRVRMALNVIIDSGFEGTMDPLTYSMNRAIKERPKGYWRCTYEQKQELAEAIDAAVAAGIPMGNAIWIASFTWNSTESTSAKSQEVEALKKEVAELKAKLAAAELESPLFYMSSDGESPVF